MEKLEWRGYLMVKQELSYRQQIARQLRNNTLRASTGINITL